MPLKRCSPKHQPCKLCVGFAPITDLFALKSYSKFCYFFRFLLSVAYRQFQYVRLIYKYIGSSRRIPSPVCTTASGRLFQIPIGTIQATKRTKISPKMSMKLVMLHTSHRRPTCSKLLLVPLNGMLVHRRVTPQQCVPFYKYTWVREMIWSKGFSCLRKQHVSKDWFILSNDPPPFLKTVI